MTMIVEPEVEDPFYLDRPQTDRGPSGHQRGRGLTREDSLPEILHKDDTRLHIPSAGRKRMSIRNGGFSKTNLNTIEKKKQTIMIGNQVRRTMGSFSHQREEEDDFSHRILGVLDSTRATDKSNELTEDDLEVLHKRRLYKKLCNRMTLIPNLTFLRQLGLTTHLHLTGLGLRAEGIKAICIVIMYEHLTVLDVSGNNLGVKGLEYVLDVVRSSDSIHTLDVSNNKIGPGNLKHITSFLLKKRTIRDMDISGNGFNDNDAKDLAKLIENDDILFSFRASNNEFGDYAGRLVGEAIKENNTLLELNLSWNHIRGKGAEEIAHGLAENLKLLSLNVAWNGFGHEGTCAMAYALRQNTTLEFLDISHNRVHQKQFFELLEGLCSNNTLQILRIGHNPIPAAYTSTFLFKLKEAKDSGLRELDMSGVIVDKEFEAILEQVQRERIFVAKFEHSLPIHVENWTDRFKTLHVRDVDKTYTVDPIRLFFYLKSNLRVVDMFREIDMDGDGVISREEVNNKLLKDGFPVSSRALDILFNFLDQDGDGMIGMLDFMEAERKYKRQVIADRKEQEERRKTISLAADPQAGSRYSSTFYQYMTKVHTNEKERIAEKISHFMNPDQKKSREENQKLTRKKSNLPPIRSLADLDNVNDDFDKVSQTDLSDILSEEDPSEDSMERLEDLAPTPTPKIELQIPKIQVSKPRGNVTKAPRRRSPSRPRRASLVPKVMSSTPRKSVSSVPKLPKIT